MEGMREIIKKFYNIYLIMSVIIYNSNFKKIV